jgi:hypothetical protein
MNVKDYLWYPYLEYQKQCKKDGRDDTITEWLVITGRIPAPPRTAVIESIEEVKEPPVIATTKVKSTKRNLLRRKKS